MASIRLLLSFLLMCLYTSGGPILAEAAAAFSMKTSPGITAADASAAAPSPSPSRIATAGEIQSFATSTGATVSLSTFGPAYRAVARASHNESIVLGYCTGFVRPSGEILHLDKMEVFKPMLKRARAENPDGFTGGGTVFGIGLLLGCLCLRHGIDSGCKIAEFLAIDDEERQHRRLVRHYKRLGLNVIRYVGDDFANVPDRLVWGGCGTLMNAELRPLLARWTPTFIGDGDGGGDGGGGGGGGGSSGDEKGSAAMAN